MIVYVFAAGVEIFVKVVCQQDLTDYPTYKNKE